MDKWVTRVVKSHIGHLQVESSSLSSSTTCCSVCVLALVFWPWLLDLELLPKNSMGRNPQKQGEPWIFGSIWFTDWDLVPKPSQKLPDFGGCRGAATKFLFDAHKKIPTIFNQGGQKISTDIFDSHQFWFCQNPVQCTPGMIWWQNIVNCVHHVSPAEHSLLMQQKQDPSLVWWTTVPRHPAQLSCRSLVCTPSPKRHCCKSKRESDELDCAFQCSGVLLVLHHMQGTFKSLTWIKFSPQDS